MAESRLYKYLDAGGGLKMLEKSNLQFTNATKFNDPFDCHPALFDYSNVPETKFNWPPADFLKEKGENDMENLRNKAWICCLSKVYDSLLMWAYYNNHKGICIGLNRDLVLRCCEYKYIGTMPPIAVEVNYKEVHPKPDYFKVRNSWIDLLTTKAKDWEHEQEVRLIAEDPSWVHAGQDIPHELYKEKVVDWKELRFYPILSRDCFESVYLGIKIGKKERTDIIEAAQKLNPEIKIYKMTLDPEALRLKAEIIES